MNEIIKAWELWGTMVAIYSLYLIVPHFINMNESVTNLANCTNYSTAHEMTTCLKKHSNAALKSAETIVFLNEEIVFPLNGINIEDK